MWPQPSDHQDGDDDKNDHKFHNGPSLADAPGCAVRALAGWARGNGGAGAHFRRPLA